MSKMKDLVVEFSNSDLAYHLKNLGYNLSPSSTVLFTNGNDDAVIKHVILAAGNQAVIYAPDGEVYVFEETDAIKMRDLIIQYNHPLRYEYNVDAVVDKLNEYILNRTDYSEGMCLLGPEDYMSWLGDPFSIEEQSDGEADVFDEYVQEYLGDDVYKHYDMLARLDSKLCYDLGLRKSFIAGGVDLTATQNPHGGIDYPNK